MAIAAVGLGACDDRRPQPLTIDNALTADEIAAGRLTPEVMWKMSRAGSSSLSPDGKTLLYAQTDRWQGCYDGKNISSRSNV